VAEERRGEEQTVARARDARRPGRAPGDVLWGRRWPGHAPLLLPVALLLGALAVRLPLLGLTAGYDLRVVAGMARRAAGGQDVYALGVQRLAPWAYFPLLLHLDAGLMRLAAHTGWSFYLLAKLPVVAADVGIGVLLYAALRRRGQAGGRAAVGMALYLYNPLVLYNGAFYGRFDAIALAFLVLALEGAGAGAGLCAPAYALASAAKTFPLFLLPLLALGRDRQDPRRLLLACALVVPLSLPEVVTDPGGLLSHAFLVDRFGFEGLSWNLILPHLPVLGRPGAAGVARVGAALYPVALLLLVRAPLSIKAACAYALFVLLSGTVYEQYLLWPLPFLIVAGLHHRRRGALGLLALDTLAGLVENEYTGRPGPLHYAAVLPNPCLPLNVVLAVATLTFVAAQVRQDPPWRRRGAAAGERERSTPDAERRDRA